jgi:hypothetical protein
MKKRGTISKDRALQIANNCSEEYIDHGETNFATKTELCETVLMMRDMGGAELIRKDMALDEIVMLVTKVFFEDGDHPCCGKTAECLSKIIKTAFKARLYEDKPEQKPSPRPGKKQGDGNRHK